MHYFPASEKPTYIRTKQKTNINSERTKIKVVIGYAFSLLVIFLFGYITYISFKKITNSVESLSNNKSESTLIKSIATGITEIRTYSKIYSITFNPSDFNNYKEKTKKVSDLIDSLELHLVNKEKYNKVDSLDVIFKAYIISINNWFTLKATGNKNYFKRLAEVLKKDGDLLTHSSKNVPLTKINTVTKILEKPIVINSVSKTDSQNGNSRRTFLEKIFGNKKKTEPSHPPTQPTSINQRITTET